MRWTSLTGIVALTLAGCALDFGTAEQSLDIADDFIKISPERCVRVPGDFTHPDPQPPPPPRISGLADDSVFVPPIRTQDQFRGLLQAELMLALELVDRGVPLRSDEIDVLVAAEDALYAYDQDAYGPLLPKVQEFIGPYSIEIPCELKEAETPIDRL